MWGKKTAHQRKQKDIFAHTSADLNERKLEETKATTGKKKSWFVRKWRGKVCNQSIIKLGVVLTVISLVEAVATNFTPS